jgi:hypothetical protein
MPKKISECTKAHLISVPLPNHAATYTVISHQFVIDYAYQALANAGFGIVDEEYRCTADGQIAQGIYKLHYNSDPELSMMFAWTNSYNKQVKFKCVVGAYINDTGSVMISGEVGSWVRKHMGTADTETKDTIDKYISNAHMYYDQLCLDKATMEGLTLNTRKQSQLLGVLFAEYGILTTEQASMVRDQMKKPTHVFADSSSLWAFYNYVTIALQLSHPKTWMEDQRILHYFISTIGNFQQCSVPAQVVQPINTVSAPVEDPLASNYGQPENQTNLLVQIAEVTGDDSVLEPSIHPAEQEIKDCINEIITQYPLTEEEVVQDGANYADDLHQSEEVVEEANEAQEVPFDIDADDDAVLGSILVPIEKPGSVATVEDYLASKNEEEISPKNSLDIFPQDGEVIYTDAAGNTFEAPIVPDLNNLSAEVVEETVIDENHDFDLEDFISNDNEDDPDSLPDFF